MISISFSLPDASSPWWRTWDSVKQRDPAVISETDLRYKCFGVNVEMIVEGVEFISKRKFITLVDLALSFRHVADRVFRGEDAAFGFTESAEVIYVRQEGAGVSVESSISQERASASSEELVNELSRFVQAAHSKLLEEVPGLTENQTIQRLGSEY